MFNAGFFVHLEVLPSQRKKFIGAITSSEWKFLWFCEFEQGFLMNHKKNKPKEKQYCS